MDVTQLLARYGGRVPRYTSYPTAPHFGPAVDGAAYAAWLAALPVAPLSLYLHVPFCDRLCLYCGCNTSMVRHEAPRRAYAALLMAEIAAVAKAIGRPAEVAQIHWGGGTPTALPADCLTAVMDAIRRAFRVLPGAEIAVELDPAHLPADRLEALGAIGVTRASLGVQDLDPAVQAAIGRVQTAEETEAAAAALRRLGIGSLNLDLIYGLPRQTEAGVARTAERALRLGADRVAVFGYAHVPWMKKQQRLLEGHGLPGPAARFAQCAAIGRVLAGAGYMPVGLDHYARPGDGLAQAALAGNLRRNFQGYTTDAAPALIGFGASAIGCLPQGYVQNAASVPEYAAALRSGRLPAVRGRALDAEDRLRRDVIERIMCDLGADLAAIAAAHDADPAPLLAEAHSGLVPFIADGLARWDGAWLQVTEAGRPFLRSVAALFDAYLRRDRQQAPPLRHALAV